MSGNNLPPSYFPTSPCKVYREAPSTCSLGGGLRCWTCGASCEAGAELVCRGMNTYVIETVAS